MPMHPEVARVLKPKASKIPIKTWSENPRSARGFYPPDWFPNFDIEYRQSKEAHDGHPGLRKVNVQYGGDHIGAVTDISGMARKTGCIIISCLSVNTAGRQTSVMLQHIANNGGKLVGSFYFTWQGQMTSGQGDIDAIFPILFNKLRAAFGLNNLKEPTIKDNPELYELAGIKTDEEQEIPLPKILKGRQELRGAFEVLKASGLDLSNAGPDVYQISKIPSDTNRQKTLMNALDDLKDARVLSDYSAEYDKGKLSGVSVMVESTIDSHKNGDIHESMKTIDNPVVFAGKKTSNRLGEYAEMTHKGITFAVTGVQDDGLVLVREGEKMVLVGAFNTRDHETINTIIREAANRIESVGLNEAANMHWIKPICG